MERWVKGDLSKWIVDEEENRKGGQKKEKGRKGGKRRKRRKRREKGRRNRDVYMHAIWVQPADEKRRKSSPDGSNA